MSWTQIKLIGIIETLLDVSKVVVRGSLSILFVKIGIELEVLPLHWFLNAFFLLGILTYIVHPVFNIPGELRSTKRSLLRLQNRGVKQ